MSIILNKEVMLYLSNINNSIETIQHGDWSIIAHIIIQTTINIGFLSVKDLGILIFFNEVAI